jgi:hypothetical protein
MAKGKPNGEASKPTRNPTNRTRRDKDHPDPGANSPQGETGQEDTPNPEWWRGDPGKRGEVL